MQLSSAIALQISRVKPGNQREGGREEGEAERAGRREEWNPSEAG